MMLACGSLAAMAQKTIYESTSDNVRVIKVNDDEYIVETINSNQAASFQNFNDNTFKNCTGKITVNGTFTNINALQNSKFTDVNLKEMVYNNTGNSGFGMIKQYFQQVKTLVLPDAQATLNKDDFNDLTSLESITFGAGAKDIPASIFSDKTTLKTVVFSNGVENIGNMAFKACSNHQQD